MKADEAKKLTENALTELQAALEAGRSEQLKTFLAALARFHRYSFGNVLLIASQRPTATRVAGFQTWKKLGRFVKRGEKSITIIAPMVFRAEEERRMAGEEHTIRGFKASGVFDVAQTDGEPLPEPATMSGDPGEYMDRLKTLVESRSIKLSYSDTLGNALGSSSGGEIKLAMGLTPANEFEVLVHELAHEILHQAKGETRPDLKSRELEAEAVAFVISHAIGLETGTAASDYLQTYHADKDTLAGSLERIQKTSSEILTAIMPAA